MRICDICKTREASYDTRAALDTDGYTKNIEICKPCYHELRKRENEHRYLAYAETVEAMTGKRPRKARWWDRIEL